jgi:hypothetical protein
LSFSFSLAANLALILSVSVLIDPTKPLSVAVNVPMVAIALSFCDRAAPIAASMAIWGPWSDRPAALRPEAQAKDGVSVLFCLGR